MYQRKIVTREHESNEYHDSFILMAIKIHRFLYTPPLGAEFEGDDDPELDCAESQAH